MWAVVMAEPAASPPTPPVATAGEPAHLARAPGGPRRLVAAASRSAPPAPPAPPPAAAVVWPAPGPLTGWFGERRGPARHPGIDIDGATGDPVVAAAAGRVVHAGPSPAGYSGYGTVVIVDHGEVTGIYAHLSEVVVRAGEEVAPGRRIGSIGTTGAVTGSHLHFELRRGGTPVDPRGWLPGGR
ncbi:MAG: murein hydrolase activator EnvC family protein [Acidimicrobiia bacterium]